jgi:hypothetical protein
MPICNRKDIVMTIEELCEKMTMEVPGDYTVRIERFPEEGGKGEDDIAYEVDHAQRVVTLKGAS